MTYYGNGLIRTLERESLATIFSSTASDGFTEQLEPVISQFYSYPLITADTLQMRIESTDLTTQIQRVFVANYERGVCGPMLSERSKNMLPVPMPFCIVYKK